jgi:hypothetical protein
MGNHRRSIQFGVIAGRGGLTKARAIRSVPKPAAFDRLTGDLQFL